MSQIFRLWIRLPLGRVLIKRIRVWWNKPLKHPWPEDIQESVHQANALAVCHRCLKPIEFPTDNWFCSECGAAVGPYNNILPYIRIFSVGETLRSGIGQQARLNFFTALGYIALSFALSPIPFFPFYAFRLLRNIRRKRKDAQANKDTDKAVKYGRIFRLATVVSILSLVMPVFVIWRFYTLPKIDTEELYGIEKPTPPYPVTVPQSHAINTNLFEAHEHTDSATLLLTTQHVGNARPLRTYIYSPWP